MELFIAVLALVVASLSALMSFFLLFHFRWSRGGPVIWIIKSYVSALSVYLLFICVLCILAGFYAHSFWTILLSTYSATIYGVYLMRLASADISKSFEDAFGNGWKKQLPEAIKEKFLKRRISLTLPSSSDFVFRQNVVFATIPGEERQLLCDLWLPSGNIQPSGLAFIYLHGGAWYYMDKDFSTRPFFKHLASQGHTVMDVGYRLYPETDMTGMVQDAKRAIAWMKANAAAYNVQPGKIVIGGGSAGGHLALMAAYTPFDKQTVPPDYPNADFSVKAAAIMYGPPDMEALYYYTDQDITTKAPKQENKQDDMPEWIQKMMGGDFHRLGYDKPPADAGALSVILGCHPEKCPGIYNYFSPLSHVHKDCPPTLLVQGEHDMFTPVAFTRRLYTKLKEANVPVVIDVLPQTEHGFDLFMPKYSPVAHMAVYDVERFLALIAAS